MGVLGIDFKEHMQKMHCEKKEKKKKMTVLGQAKCLWPGRKNSLWLHRISWL